RRPRGRDVAPAGTRHRSLVALRPAAPVGLREEGARRARRRLSRCRTGRRSPAAPAALSRSAGGRSAGRRRHRFCVLRGACGYYPGRAPTIVISTVIPVFNNGDAMVRECHAALAHVPATIAEPAEIVFVDDGSRDGTLEGLKAVQRGDPRVRIVELTANF